MAHSLRALAVLLSLALVCPSPVFAQKDKEDKEKKKQDAKAHELIDENSKYKKLPKYDQKAVIDHLVYKIDQSEKEIQKAWLNVYTGETLAEILAQHPDSKSCDI